MADLAVAVAPGGVAAADIAVLRAQPGVFGAVASDPDGVAADRDVGRGGGDRGQFPLGRPSGDGCGRTWKKGFEFHSPCCPLWITAARAAGTGRAAAAPGQAGSNAAADHIVVLDAALAGTQLPAALLAPDETGRVAVLVRPDETGRVAVLVRTDAASVTTEFARALHERGAAQPALPHHRLEPRPGRRQRVAADLLAWPAHARLSTLPTP